ncbi:MAG: hypothetical protein Q7S99_13390 [Parvibaculum sp.]|nr:hypothetical protein [Parvibaculum sp.]
MGHCNTHSFNDMAYLGAHPMYQVLYSGYDTLDIAFSGAFPHTVLESLEAARTDAESFEKDQPAQIGPDNVPVLVKSNGRRGGFRYVFDNGPTGAIFAAKKNTDPKQWNLFVSIRALRLLTLGYTGTKEWLHETLAAMGFQITEISVNRIDYAVDILAPKFKLDIANFIAPAQAKARPYWSKENWIENEINAPKAVLRGRRFESVTIGTMPNRQVIVYDKRRAALDKRELYWFDAWGLDKDDPSAQVWRIEIRAGRDALAKLTNTKRPYEVIEAVAKKFFIKAAEEIRYLESLSEQRNISRVPSHPIWTLLKDTLMSLPTSPTPPLLEARALEMLRRQRLDMAIKQGCGNLVNALILDGISPENVATYFIHYVPKIAETYQSEIGEKNFLLKSHEVHLRSKFLLPT